MPSSVQPGSRRVLARQQLALQIGLGPERLTVLDPPPAAAPEADGHELGGVASCELQGRRGPRGHEQAGSDHRQGHERRA